VLLNALELGAIQRLGGQRMIEVDTRIIASSSANIEVLIAQGSFRADLYYRLSSFLIDVPPLRERPRDIPFIVERILNRLSAQLDIPLKLGNGVMDLLKRAPWYGNVREIESVLTRAAMQAKPDGVIELQRLPVTLYRPNLGFIPPEDHLQSLREMERSAILHAALVCNGNTTLMAQGLGISRTTLWRRIKELGLDIKDNQVDVSKQNNIARKSVSV
jgi:transcriptional activator for dhaKLM operon